MRRAARCDGAVPLFTDARHGHVPPVDQVRDLVDYIHQHRSDDRHDFFAARCEADELDAISPAKLTMHAAVVRAFRIPRPARQEVSLFM
jgi:hypothetical protein